jgi:hypothetical protein
MNCYPKIVKSAKCPHSDLRKTIHIMSKTTCGRSFTQKNYVNLGQTRIQSISIPNPKYVRLEL